MHAKFLRGVHVAFLVREATVRGAELQASRSQGIKSHPCTESPGASSETSKPVKLFPQSLSPLLTHLRTQPHDSIFLIGCRTGGNFPHTQTQDGILGTTLRAHLLFHVSAISADSLPGPMKSLAMLLASIDHIWNLRIKQTAQTDCSASRRLTNPFGVSVLRQTSGEEWFFASSTVYLQSPFGSKATSASQRAKTIR